MPNIRKSIFNRKNLDFLLSKIDKSSIPNLTHSLEIIERWANLVRSGSVYKLKETGLQGFFLKEIFSDVLGYQTASDNPLTWNLNQEQATEIGGKSADGSLGFFTPDETDIRAVIELKDANTNPDEKQHRQNDNRTPVEQAFSYKHQSGKKCLWIIVSNFVEIRLYHHLSSAEYEVFNIEELTVWENFRKFHYLLSFNNLIAPTGESAIDRLYKNNEAEEQNISKELYSIYKQTRIKLFEHLKLNNPDKTELLLLEKTQKLLDRFIFVCFCEDNRLLPDKTFRSIIETGKKSYSMSETKIWNELKGLFEAINSGSPGHNINRFNGGLFATDYVLDDLVIKDSILEEMAKLADYDFDSDVDVNILGHIFEQSITDIEELKAGFENREFDRKTSKRKKEGIFYTPEYITKYIVENAIGSWLDDRRKELGFLDLPELTVQDMESIRMAKGKAAIKYNDNVRKHIEFWEAYREKLRSIKVLDPACGSGAFLNQAFNYLYAEGQKVNEKLNSFQIGMGQVFDLDRQILSNNLYGVDLNSESVEITKLSLWLKTANKYSELTALDNNIKCGNSLIDDPAVAGEKAFNWFQEFPSVFPGYREYDQKLHIVPGYHQVTIEEIRERKLQEPSVEYLSSTTENNSMIINDPSYSYKPGSKGFEHHGFDVIIGNPPWGGKLSRDEIDYISNKYTEISNGEIDTYVIFLMKAMNLLIKNGFIGIIIPDTWLSLQRSVNLRKIINNKMMIIDVYDRYKPFEDAKDTRSHSLILRKNQNRPYCFTVKVSDAALNIIKNYSLNSSILDDVKEWNIYKSNEEDNVFQKMTSISMNLGELYNLKYGLRTGNNNKYLNENDIHNLGLKIARGAHIQRYYFNWNKEFLITKEGLPNSYFCSDNLKEKIIVQRIRTNSTDNKCRWLEATLIEEDNFIALDSTSFICEKNDNNLKYLLTILCSNLMNMYYKAHYTDVNVKPIYLEKLPIPFIPPDAQAPFIAAADIMLERNKELQEVKNKFLDLLKNDFNLNKVPAKLQNWTELSWADFTGVLKKVKIDLRGEQKEDWLERFNRLGAKAKELKKIIDETDKKIDAMVYELYGLTEEEIKIVEGEE